MSLWIAWFQAVACLRPACSRWRTYCWMVLVLMGLSVRTDLAGVTSLVRSLALRPSDYKRLLHHFHSSGLDRARLSAQGRPQNAGRQEAASRVGQ